MQENIKEHKILHWIYLFFYLNNYANSFIQVKEYASLWTKLCKMMCKSHKLNECAKTAHSI